MLKDILASDAIPSVRLNEIHRQSEDSMIVFNAHRINAGEPPVLNKKGGDFFIERKESPAQAAQTIVDLAHRRLPGFAHVDALTGIQVLAPARKGETGVHALNAALQAAFNPHRPASTSVPPATYSCAWATRSCTSRTTTNCAGNAATSRAKACSMAR